MPETPRMYVRINKVNHAYDKRPLLARSSNTESFEGSLYARLLMRKRAVDPREFLGSEMLGFRCQLSDVCEPGSSQ